MTKVSEPWLRESIIQSVNCIVTSRAASAARNIELFIQIIEALWKMGTREFRLDWNGKCEIEWELKRRIVKETPSHLPISIAFYIIYIKLSIYQTNEKWKLKCNWTKI